MSGYTRKPTRFLSRLHSVESKSIANEIYCAGFELGVWRCNPFAEHLIEWLLDYAMTEEELQVTHANAYIKLKQAAVRVYTSEKHKKRGEVGEIALHAICRDWFDTIPISPRVFYKSASNDTIKSFDLIHARILPNSDFEIWIGEAKLYKDTKDAIDHAIASILQHISEGFLRNQKLILGPQIPKATPHYEKILHVFRTQTSLDEFLHRAVFVIGILGNSETVKKSNTPSPTYVSGVTAEIQFLEKAVHSSKLAEKIKIRLIYVPMRDKDIFVDEFDKRLKGLQ